MPWLMRYPPCWLLTDEPLLRYLGDSNRFDLQF